MVEKLLEQEETFSTVKIPMQKSLKRSCSESAAAVSDDDPFRIVGAGYKVHTVQTKKLSFRQRMKGKPIVSLLILAVIVTGCILAPLLANHDPSRFYLDHVNEAPGREFFFGTDSLGRDLYSMIWYGGRVSLLIGLLGAAVSSAIGVVYGCISGTASAVVDTALMRAVEICSSIPTLLFVIILAAVIRADSIVSISIVIGVTGWFALSRIVRSEVRQIRNMEYVLYARSSGGKMPYVMWHHLIPNFLSAVMFVIVSSVSTSITMESTLSFLGLGLPVDQISWGSMLSLANKALVMNTWWVIVIPGLFLIVTLMCITSVGSFFRKETNRLPSRL